MTRKLKETCAHGHPLTPENRSYPRGIRHGRCRECQRQWSREAMRRTYAYAREYRVTVLGEE